MSSIPPCKLSLDKQKLIRVDGSVVNGAQGMANTAKFPASLSRWCTKGTHYSRRISARFHRSRSPSSCLASMCFPRGVNCGNHWSMLRVGRSEFGVLRMGMPCGCLGWFRTLFNIETVGAQSQRQVHVKENADNNILCLALPNRMLSYQ
jgi:hypothetical protein